MRIRRDIKPLYPEIVRLFEEGWSYREGAKKLGIPLGSFAGTIVKLRAQGVIIERSERQVDARHYEVPKKVSLPKLRFMENK